MDAALLSPAPAPPSWPPALQVLLRAPAVELWSAVLGPPAAARWVEVVSPAGRWSLEVVRPAVGDLVARHATLTAAVPVPPVLAAIDDGVVVLPGLPAGSLARWSSPPSPAPSW
ncbi:hypothetical protein [Blastococcus saxobsidens]|uniref:Uncharacterized protein n=1 Tax=Blastococcus saxobsidens (strain DD2) TaxID=1146883 RepID=H6RUK2_BLASD|nr:hypothetical protein [Blastococcus saxobsidens]CCG03169.1 protein of unknown function [Blastococcus saxobsidens DD2]